MIQLTGPPELINSIKFIACRSGYGVLNFYISHPVLLLN
jgi:hypothetical protein